MKKELSYRKMYGKEEGRQKMKKDYDEIRIEDLEVFANHGVFPEENVLGQKFLVSAVLYTDTRRAGLTDDLSASIHYGEVSAFIDRYLREHTFQLLERAAEALAEELLLHTAGLEKIRLEIKKPWAPVRLPLKTVSVVIERQWHTSPNGDAKCDFLCCSTFAKGDRDYEQNQKKRTLLKKERIHIPSNITTVLLNKLDNESS